MTTADAARRRVRYFALGIAALFGAIVFVNWWSGRENLREGSRIVSQGGAPLRIDHIPVSYHAVYRVEDRAGEDPVFNTEKVWYRRPFEGRIETWRGKPPGSRRTSVRQSAFGIFTSSSIGAETPLRIAAPPSLASGDLRLDAAVEEAVRRKVFLRRERREVFGRQCQVYRAGGPVFAGEVTPYEPGQGTYTDVCIDRNGLVLEEHWVDKEKVLRRRVAVELEIDPPLGREVFDITVEADPKIPPGSVDRIRRDESDELWELERTPEGFDHLGRYSVVVPSLGLSSQQPGAPPPSRASTADVYVRGPDLVVVEQDPTLAELAGRENRPERSVQLDTLADAKVLLDARMNEVRGRTRDRSFVRIFGTLPTSDLIELAEGLRPPAG